MRRRIVSQIRVRPYEPRPGADFSIEDTETAQRVLRADIISEALDSARNQPHAAYLTAQEAWLGVNIKPLARAAELLFKFTVESRGPDDANAARLGALLGGSILQLAVERGLIDQDTCLATAHEWQVGDQGMVYSGANYSFEDATNLFGKEAAEALEEIKSPVSRTTCMMTVGMALIPHKAFHDKVSTEAS